MHAGVIENLFASDLAFLQDLYRRVNREGDTRAAVGVPGVRHEFTVDMAGGRLGGIVTYAADRLYEEVAYVAYHFHWSLEEILDLEHPVRGRFANEYRAHEPPSGRVTRHVRVRQAQAAIGK